MKKTKRIIPLALAATTLMSGTAFAYDIGKYEVRVTDETVHVTDDTGTVSREYTAADDGDNVTYSETGVTIGDINETVADKRHGTVIVWSGPEVTTGDVSVTSQLTAETTESQLIAVIVRGESDLTAGNVSAVNAGSTARTSVAGMILSSYVDDGTMEVSAENVSVSNSKGYACGVSVLNRSGECQTQTVELGNVSAEAAFGEDPGAYSLDATGVYIFSEYNNKTSVTAKSLTGTYKDEYGYGYGAYTNAENSSEIDLTVSGDITGSSAGVAMYGNSGGKTTINCLGSVIGTEGANDSSGAWMCGNENIDSELNVSGNITGDECGVWFWGSGECREAVNCLGTISGTDEAVVIQGLGDAEIDITTWKLMSEGLLLTSDLSTENEDALAKVNYIVKTNNSNSTIVLTAADGSELSTTGDAFDEEYKTQNEGKDIVVKVQAADGYEVTGLNAGTATDGSRITAVKNADGTWTITVPRGGGIDITPILEAIAKQENQDSVTIIPSSLSTNWDGSKTYYKANGEAAMNEWQLITVDGVQAWYHFDENCKMNTGWMTDANDGYTYYLDPVTGKMATGIVEIDGKQYHFNETVTGSSGWKQNAAGQWVYEKQDVIPLGALIG